MSLIIDFFAQEPAEGNILGLHMCLRDKIFRVFLKHFISEVVRKCQRDKMFSVLLVHFFYKFCEQVTRRANF